MLVESQKIHLETDDVKIKNKNKAKASANAKANTKNNKLLGQGSYGCVYYPGITCTGKLNKKVSVTKLQEITFYSSNEISIGKYIKKYIPNYNILYAPVIKYCIVSFQTIQKSDLDILECETIFPDTINKYYKNYNQNYRYNQNYGYNDSSSYSYKPTPEYLKSVLLDKLNTKYYLMYINYVANKSFKNYFQTNNVYNIYVVNVIKVFFILINSLNILSKNNIIHNDLHINNILIDLKYHKPIIIDFGLSIFLNKCFTSPNKTINFTYLKSLIFDFREDQYHVILEKRFLSFILYNKSQSYSVDIHKNFQKNVLTKSIIDLFINDSYETIRNQKVIHLSKFELAEYYKSLKQFYYQFLNKHKYSNYTTIVVYLLKYVLNFTDLYSLVFDIYYINYIIEIKNETSSGGSKPLFDFFMLLYKKTLHPIPSMRLQHAELIHIYNYIMNYMKHYETAINYEIFIKDFRAFLISQSIDLRIVFYKKFAYIDFKTIINIDVFEFVKNSF